MGTPGQDPCSNTRRLSSPALEDHCAWLGCPCWGGAQECVGVAGAYGAAAAVAPATAPLCRPEALRVP